MAKSYKSDYQAAKDEIRTKDEEISRLSREQVVLQTQLATISADDKQKDSKISSLEEKVEMLESTREELQETNETLSQKLREKELGRFASGYLDQENEYGKLQEFWFRLSLLATGLLTASILFSIFEPAHLGNTIWYHEPGFYLLNLIFLTLFIYALKQHAHYGNLRIDYANRKTLAQSYQYIISSEDGHPEIRTRFIEKAADIFSSKAMYHNGEVTLYEAILAKMFGAK